MTYHRPVHWTDHAIRRMRRRRVRRQEVRRVLALGERWIEAVTTHGTYYGKSSPSGRSIWTGKPREVTVIYLEDAKRILVVTVEVLGEYDEPEGG